MFYLFIFESIGTSELMLIGLIALIVFGPRKLPELARTIGKTMAEFRRSTDEFKQTWQQEIMIEESKNGIENQSNLRSQSTKVDEKTIGRDISIRKIEITEPEIKLLNKDVFDEKVISQEVKKNDKPEIKRKVSNKREWL